MPQNIAYNWIKDGVSVEGASNKSYTIDVPGIYYIEMPDSCGTAKSNTIIISRDSIPEINLIAKGEKTLCPGNSVDLFPDIKDRIDFREGFETGNLKKFDWKIYGHQTWEVQQDTVYNSKHALSVSIIDKYSGEQDSRTAGIYVSVYYPQNDSVSFYFRCNPAINQQVFFYINDTLKLNYYNYHDSNKSWNKRSYAVHKGVNKFRWYTYTGYFAENNILTIDDISIGNATNYKYQWLKNNNNIAGATKNMYYAKEEGDYKLHISNNCGEAVSESVSILNNVKASITPANDIILCGDSLITLTANYTNGISYQWQKNTINIPGETNSQFTIHDSQFGSGSYRVIENITNGCSDTSKTISIFFNHKPDIIIVHDTTICAGSSYIIDSGLGFTSYLWSTGDTTQSISVDSTGVGFGTKQLSVKVTDNNGCSATAIVNVTFDNCSGIKEIDKSLGFIIRPNPSDGKITLETNGLNQFALDVFDCFGQKVYSTNLSRDSKTVNSQFTIDLSHHSAGLYFISITDDKTCITKKLVIR